jgi:hypothetical protein
MARAGAAIAATVVMAVIIAIVAAIAVVMVVTTVIALIATVFAVATIVIAVAAILCGCRADRAQIGGEYGGDDDFLVHVSSLVALQ